jgi:hypothetical protein
VRCQQLPRIACLLNGPTLVLVSLHARHDKVYRR